MVRYGAQAWHKRAALGGGSVPAEVSDTPGTFRTQTHKLGAQSVAAPSRMISLPPAAHTHRRCLACAEPIRSVVYSSVHLLSRKLSCVTGSHHSALHAKTACASFRASARCAQCVLHAVPCHAMRCRMVQRRSVACSRRPPHSERANAPHRSTTTQHRYGITPLQHSRTLNFLEYPEFLEYPFSPQR